VQVNVSIRKDLSDKGIYKSNMNEYSIISVGGPYAREESQAIFHRKI